MSSNRRQFFCSFLALAVAVAGIFFAQANVAQASGKDPAKIEGILVSIDLATASVTIKKQGGVLATVVVPPTAKVERNGVRAKLSSFKLNDTVQVVFSASVVSKIEAVGP